MERPRLYKIEELLGDNNSKRTKLAESWVDNCFKEENTLIVSGCSQSYSKEDPEHPREKYRKGKSDILSTNYLHSNKPSLFLKGLCKYHSNGHQELPQLLKSMTELADLYPNPYQWMAGFISTSSKLRPTHVDWYDSLLVPLKGSKILQVGNRPYKKISGMFYSYSEDHGFSDSSYLEEQVTVTPAKH